MVTLPTVLSDWTQADGYHARAVVTDCTVDPDNLDASNYLRTIAGFGDLATSTAIYSVLHAAYQRHAVRNAKNVTYRFGGDPASLYIYQRLTWAAVRKDIISFRVNEGHAVASAHVGQRVEIDHKRYRKADLAGSSLFGTVVARYWYPDQGQTQITVMLDPVDLIPS